MRLNTAAGPVTRFRPAGPWRTDRYRVAGTTLCSAVEHQRRQQRQRASVAGVAVRRRRVAIAIVVAAAGNADNINSAPPSSLSDLIAFESEVERKGEADGEEEEDDDDDNDDPTLRAQAIIGRATKVLEAARAALGAPEGGVGVGASAAASASSSGGPPSTGAGPPPPAAFGAPPPSTMGPPVGSIAASGDLTRAVLRGALERDAKSAAAAAPGSNSSNSGNGSSSSSSSSSSSPSSSGMPDWASGLLARDDEDVFLNTPPMMMGGGDDEPEGNGGGSGGPITTGGWPGAAASASSLPSQPGSAGNSGGLRLAPALGAAMLAAAPAPASAAQPLPVAFADDSPLFGRAASSLDLPSQAVADAERARRTTELPPLQSVVELTSAFRPPERGADAATATTTTGAVAAASTAGRDLPDGSGVLPDGTRYEKSSGIEYGANGYWRRWRTLRGSALVPVAADGSAMVTGSVAAAAARAQRAGSTQRMARVEFEETWWEASDYAGLRVMGAEKRGRDAQGGQWRERWEERLFYASAALDGVVERSAHKWARAPLPAGSPADAAADEWEERWDEHYHASGRASKSADKWGKQGPNVWHERWGEDYDGAGACVKWTDKWAERLLGPDGRSEQWGDKWHEEFADGRGRKNGEVWSVAADGGRYQRWWGEDHPGGGVVRRHGHSTGGESWDDTVPMDTYYNPIPHFGYQLAVEHSPQLMNVPLRPRTTPPPAEAQQGGGGGGGGGGGDDDDPFGPGLDSL